MAGFQIFSDGSCDMPRNIAQQQNIQIVPFYVSLNSEQYYKEIEEISLDTFYHYIIDEKGFPKTSLPSTQDYMDAFTPFLEQGQDILCFTITDTLSGSLQSASTAKIMLQESYPTAKIIIINSWHATGSQYLMVLEAARMQQAGAAIEEVAAMAEKAKVDGRIIFMVGALNHLEKGGRIGKIAALSGSILNIKPLIILKNSEITVGGMTRSRKKGIQKMAELAKTHFIEANENPENYRFMVGTTDTWEETEPYATAVKSVIPNISFEPPFQIGATIAAHTGPGTLGLCFMRKFDTY